MRESDDNRTFVLEIVSLTATDMKLQLISEQGKKLPR